MKKLILLLSVSLLVILTISWASYSRRDSKRGAEQHFSLTSYRWADPSPGYSMTVESSGTTTVAAWMEAKIENLSDDDAFNVRATLAKVPSDATIIDGSLVFNDVKARSAKWSEDSFRIRVASKTPDPESTVWWDIEWEDAKGNHYIVQSVPMLGLHHP